LEYPTYVDIRIKAAEAEVHSPPITKETILLRLGPMLVQTYNCIQSTIVVKERKNEDYIFHPKMRLSC
jgi:hypothetical protein